MTRELPESPPGMTLDQIEQTPTLSVRQVAVVLGISHSHAYALNERGELPGAFRLGERVLISGPALAAFLRTRHTPEATAA